VYGPVRTVVWQGSAGDRRPYADQRPLSFTIRREYSISTFLARSANHRGCVPIIRHTVSTLRASSKAGYQAVGKQNADRPSLEYQQATVLVMRARRLWLPGVFLPADLKITPVGCRRTREMSMIWAFSCC
jgi:hypothetical protein